MKAISTKTLLDFFTNTEESKKIGELFKKIERNKEKIYVSKYTVIEVVYILEKSFGLGKDKVYYIIKTLLEDRLFKIDDLRILEEALSIYKEGKDFLEALKGIEYEKHRISEVL